MPELALKAGFGSIRGFAFFHGNQANLFPNPDHAAKSVNPEAVNLDRLAMSWGHYPFPDLCVHPSQLHTRLALPQQPVGGVHSDSKFRALDMSVEYLPKYRGH